MPTMSTTPETPPPNSSRSCKQSFDVVSRGDLSLGGILATALASSRSRSMQSTRAPAWESAWQVCLPLPWPAPRTTKPRPSRREGLLGNFPIRTTSRQLCVVTASHDRSTQAISGEPAVVICADDELSRSARWLGVPTGRRVLDCGQYDDETGHVRGRRRCQSVIDCQALPMRISAASFHHAASNKRADRQAGTSEAARERQAGISGEPPAEGEARAHARWRLRDGRVLDDQRRRIGRRSERAVTSTSSKFHAASSAKSRESAARWRSRRRFGRGL